LKKLLSIFLVFFLTLATFSLNGLIQTKASNVSNTTALQQLVGEYEGSANFDQKVGIYLKVYEDLDGKYTATIIIYSLNSSPSFAVIYEYTQKPKQLCGFQDI